MKRNWIVMLLVLIVAISMTAFTASAAGNHAADCECGGVIGNVGNHTYTPVTWTELSGEVTRATFNAGGNFRLTGNVTFTDGRIQPNDNTVVRIDLNGNTMTAQANNRIIFLEDSTNSRKVTFTDSKGGGRVVIPGGSSYSQTGLDVYENNNVTLYAGTIDFTNMSSSATTCDIILSNASASFTMYGGSILGSSTGSRFVVRVGWHDNVRFDMYGGQITSQNNNYAVMNWGTSYLYGGTVSGGFATGVVNTGAHKVYVVGETNILKGSNGLGFAGVQNNQDLNVTQMTGGSIYVSGVASDKYYPVVANAYAQKRFFSVPEGYSVFYSNDEKIISFPAGTYQCECGGKGTAVEGHVCQDIYWNKISGSVDVTTLNAGGNYILTGPVQLSNLLDPAADTVLRIDLNGNTLTAAADTRLINLNSVTSGTKKVVITDSAENGRAVIPGGNTSGVGLAIYENGNVTMYAGKLDFSGFTSTSAAADMILSAAGATFTMYGGEILGSTTGSRFVVRVGQQDRVAFDMYGGRIVGQNTNHTVMAWGALTMHKGQITNNNETTTCATVSLGGDLRSGSLTISGGSIVSPSKAEADVRVTHDVNTLVCNNYSGDLNVLIGGTVTDGRVFGSYTGTAPDLDYAADNTLAIAAENGQLKLVQAVANVGGKRYASVDAAVAAAGTDMVKLMANVDAIDATGKTLYLDLNGKTVGTVTAAALYGVDSATNGYGTSAGVITAVNATVNPLYKYDDGANIRRYLAVENNGTYTFNRYYMAVTKVAINPSSTAFNYEVSFLGNDVIEAAVEAGKVEFGMKFKADLENTDWVEAAMETEFVGGPYVEENLTHNVKRFGIANTLKVGQNNAERAAMDIKAKAYVKVGETVVDESAEITRSFRQLVEKADAAWAAGTLTNETLQNSLKKMYQDWTSVMEGWALSKINVA